MTYYNKKQTIADKELHIGVFHGFIGSPAALLPFIGIVVLHVMIILFHSQKEANRPSYEEFLMYFVSCCIIVT